MSDIDLTPRVQRLPGEKVRVFKYRPGVVVTASDRKYRVMPNGEWRRVYGETEAKTEAAEAQVLR